MNRIIDEIDRHLELKELEKQEGKNMISHHPSSMSACSRAIVYRWLHAPVTDPNDATGIWRMKLGDVVHKLYAELLVEMGYDVQSEVEITWTDPRLKYPIHGYMDNVIVSKDGDNPIEVKSVWAAGVKAIQEKGPRSQDVGQCAIYAMCEEYDKLILEYIARDTLWRDEFNLKFTPEKREQIKEAAVQKFMKIEHAVENNIELPREYKAIVWDGEIRKTKQINGVKYKSDWQCLYCVRRSYCYRNEIDNMINLLPEG